MAENTDDEPIEPPANMNSENTSEEITPSNEPEAITNNQEIENMEVHHHAHASHGKKNWKSYFWEFMMLFLAVFCGFLAEYKLEHTIEQQRESQYIRSYIEDLQMDTANYAALISNNLNTIRGIDTLLANYTEFSSGRCSPAFMNHYWAITGFTNIKYTERTIQQLKNSGGLRLIHNNKVAISITFYDATVRQAIKEEESVARLFETVSNNYIELFDLKKYETELKRNQNDLNKLALDRTADFLLTHDRQKIGSFYHYLTIYNQSIEGIRQNVKILKVFSENLVKLIKEEYDLK